MKTLIQNGRIVTAQDSYQADILIEEGSVSAIGRNLPVETDQTVDASGLLVIPGGVDVHTHLDMPFGGTVSSDDFETGTRAAAFGGTTTLIDFAIQAKGQSMRSALDTWFRKAPERFSTDAKAASSDCARTKSLMASASSRLSLPLRNARRVNSPGLAGRSPSAIKRAAIARMTASLPWH